MSRLAPADRPRQLPFVGFCTRTDHDIAHDNLQIGCGTGCRRIHHAVIDPQFREDRQGRHALGQNQVAFAYLPAPIVDLPAGGAVLACNIGDLHTRHHAFRRDPRPLGLRPPPTPAGAFDHLEPGNSNTR